MRPLKHSEVPPGTVEVFAASKPAAPVQAATAGAG